MMRKTSQLQIRVTPEQKRILKQLAKLAGMDVSSWVLSQVLPHEADEFQRLAARLCNREFRREHLAELADFLGGLGAAAFQRAVTEPPRARLDPATLNYLAGAIELAATRRRVPPPAWISKVLVPENPIIGSELGSVRLHLLTSSPVALRRRNVFVDASIDDRV
jgi:hypothetical protein